MEFPLLQWLAAVLFLWLCESDLVCRGVAIAFSLSTVVALFGLVAACGGERYGALPSSTQPRRPRSSSAVPSSPIRPWSVSRRSACGDLPRICGPARGALVWGVVTAALASVSAACLLLAVLTIVWERRWALLRSASDRSSRWPCSQSRGTSMQTCCFTARVSARRSRMRLARISPTSWLSPYLRGRFLIRRRSQLRYPAFYTTLAERSGFLLLLPLSAVLVLFGAVAVRRFRTGEHRCVVRDVVFFVLVSATRTSATVPSTADPVAGRAVPLSRGAARV